MSLRGISWHNLSRIIGEDHNQALSRGMQGLSVRIAKAMNRLMGTRGAVLGDHYHAHLLETPTRLVNAIACVLGNAENHYGPTTGPDPFSSAACERQLLLCAVVSWLLRVGWRRARRATVTQRTAGQFVMI